MNRTRLNLAVDALSLAAFTAVASTGLVLQWSLPPGSGRLDAVGCSGSPEVLVVWGWSRHQWGQLHTWAVYLLLAILALHVGLHWRWLQATLGRQAPPGSGRRLALGVVALAWLALTALPLLGRPHAVKRPLPEAGGQAFYEQQCLSCHGLAATFPALPAESQAAAARLREAQPAAPHAMLRSLPQAQLEELLRYIQKSRY